MKSSYHPIELTELQTFLGVYSGCYQIEWEKNEANNRLDLYISFPQDENNNKIGYSHVLSKNELDKRKLMFRQFVVNLMRNRHELFLKNLAPPVTNYNYKSQGVWHHLFNVEEIREVEVRAELPYKPKSQNVSLFFTKKILELFDNARVLDLQ